MPMYIDGEPTQEEWEFIREFERPVPEVTLTEEDLETWAGQDAEDRRQEQMEQELAADFSMAVAVAAIADYTYGGNECYLKGKNWIADTHLPRWHMAYLACYDLARREVRFTVIREAALAVLL